MSFLFTPASSRQSHVKHSPSLTLERGESHLRNPKPIRSVERTSFYTNLDTGIDLDGELKSGYASGDVQSLSPSPDASMGTFEQQQIAASTTLLSSSQLYNRRRSSTSPIPQAFAGQSHFVPISRNTSRQAELNEQRARREVLRRKRMRQAGSTIHFGTISVLLIFMLICLLVIVAVYLKVR
ncbi:hypothetical protein CPB86DRAFT_694073 [Serendipita vermifera]|nr:hypothetical protein CPB86DRAFT_694073 [Serendipita vermifera]